MYEVKEYRIETSDQSEKLSDLVRHYIQKGWQPFGGVSIAIYENRDKVYAQAIVKYNTITKKG